MKKLYSLSYHGRMMHFCGEVPEELYDMIEQIGNAIDKTLSFEEFCEVFSKEILFELNLELIRCPVTHIFRIR